MKRTSHCHSNVGRNVEDAEPAPILSPRSATTSSSVTPGTVIVFWRSRRAFGASLSPSTADSSSDDESWAMLRVTGPERLVTAAWTTSTCLKRRVATTIDLYSDSRASNPTTRKPSLWPRMDSRRAHIEHREAVAGGRLRRQQAGRDGALNDLTHVISVARRVERLRAVVEMRLAPNPWRVADRTGSATRHGLERYGFGRGAIPGIAGGECLGRESGDGDQVRVCTRACEDQCTSYEAAPHGSAQSQQHNSLSILPTVLYRRYLL